MRNRLLPLALLGLALLAGGGLWLATRSGRSREQAAARPGAERLEPAEPTELAEEHPADLPGSPGAAEELAVPEQATVRPARAVASTEREAELARALWVEGRVVFPADTPLDERVKVVARGRRFEHGPQHAAAVAADGSFRVAFAEETKTGWLDLEARYLFLDEPLKVAPRQAGRVVLAARLGGVLRGRVLPPDGPHAARKPGGWLVTLDGSGGEGSDVRLRRELDASCEFVFTALPPDAEYDLRCDALVYEPAAEQIRVTAGGETILDLQVQAGVNVAGRVVDESGASVAGASVLSRVDQSPGRMRQTLTDAKGAFALRGISPGSITLFARAKGRLPLDLELGELERGAERSGLRLELDRGLSIAGLVRWPEGTPAEGATVIAEPLEHGEDLNHAFVSLSVDREAAADPTGRFTITGLEPGPHQVVAIATREEKVLEMSKVLGRERERTVRTTLRAIRTGVEAGTAGLVLEIPNGETVRGVVLDDLGNPVDDFRVTATRFEPEGRSHLPGSTQIRGFEGTDGAFVLTGLEPGNYSLEVEAEGCLDSRAVELHVPLEAELAPIRLTRKARLSGLVLTPLGEPAPQAAIESARLTRFRPAGTADGEGRFQIDGLEPGALKVRAALEGYAPSEALELELAPGAAPEHVMLRLRKGATLTGMVLDAHGSGAALRKVEISRGRFTAPKSSRTVMTDETGRFELAGLDPGTYSIVVPPTAAELDALGFSRSTGAAEALSGKAEVEITDGGGHVVLAAANAQAVRVFGTVTLGGKPASAKIGIGWGDSRKRVWIPVDASGAYDLALPAPGDYSLAVYLEDSGATVAVPAAIQGPREQRLDVDLPAGEPVEAQR